MTEPLLKCPVCGARFRRVPGAAYAHIRSLDEDMCLACSVSYFNSVSDGRLGDVLQKAAREAEAELRRGGGRE